MAEDQANHDKAVAMLRDKLLGLIDLARTLGATPVLCAEAVSSALATMAMDTTDPVSAIREATKNIVEAVEARVAEEAAVKAASEAPTAPPDEYPPQVKGD